MSEEKRPADTFLLIEAGSAEELTQKVNQVQELTDKIFRRSYAMLESSEKLEGLWRPPAYKFFAEMCSPISIGLSGIRAGRGTITHQAGRRRRYGVGTVVEPGEIDVSKIKPVGLDGKFIDFEMPDDDVRKVFSRLYRGMRDNPKIKEMFLEPVLEMLKDFKVPEEPDSPSADDLNSLFGGTTDE